MRTLIINGSPKAKNGNTEIFIQKFINGMKSPCQISYVAKEDIWQGDIMRKNKWGKKRKNGRSHI